MKQTATQDLKIAREWFNAGKFVEAEALYTRALVAEPDNPQVLTRLGSLALLGNRLNDAQQWLDRALDLKRLRGGGVRDRIKRQLHLSTGHSPEALLAQVHYLRDDYRQAAPLFKTTGATAQAAKLASFGNTPPYQLPTHFSAAHVKFIRTDPLPVVQVRVNGRDPVNFFVDTGGAEIIIDTAYAAEVGATLFGEERGVFGGGKTASIQHGRIDTLTLSDLTVKQLPVTIMPVRHFSDPIAEGLRLDGIIGTFFLYHFLVALDYPGGELILRQKMDQNPQQLEHVAGRQASTQVPFWMADHYMVAWGTVNGSGPLLFFVDTGLAGNAFTCPASTLQNVNIQLRRDLATTGLGGGGKMNITPIEIEELTLGEAQERNLHGVAGAFPPQLERAFGFQIGGLISHEFFCPYTFTLDFTNMRYFLERKE